MLKKAEIIQKKKNSPNINGNTSSVLTRSRIKNKTNLIKNCNSPSQLLSRNHCNIINSNKSPLSNNEQRRPETVNAQIQTDIFSSNISIMNELLGKSWLSDDIIQHYFDLLNNKLLQNTPFTIVNPLIIHGVKNINDFNHFLDPLKLHEMNVLIMPINDSSNLMQVGGSHWSVLFYDKLTERFYHYDSLNDHNHSSAQTVAKKMYFYLTRKSYTTDIITIRGPSQFNTYDCGIYMILAVELMIMNLIQSNDLNVGPFQNIIVNEAVLIQKRSTLAYIINNTTQLTKDVFLSLIFSSRNDKNYYCNKCEFNEQGFNAINNVNNNKNTPLIYFKRPTITVNKKNTPIMSSKSLTESEIKINSKYKSVCVLGDSHARGLADKLDQILPSSFKVTGLIKPNAECLQVLDNFNKKLSNEDLFVLLCGSNDIYNGHIRNIYRNLEAKLQKFKKCTILMCGIPFRRDISLNHRINDDIFMANLFIQDISHKMTNVKYIDLGPLSTKFYSKDGVHLNNKGKNCVVNILKKNILFNNKEAKPSQVKRCETNITTNSTKRINTLYSPISTFNQQENLTSDPDRSLVKGWDTPDRTNITILENIIGRKLCDLNLNQSVNISQPPSNCYSSESTVTTPTSLNGTVDYVEYQDTINTCQLRTAHSTSMNFLDTKIKKSTFLP